jgi:histidinol-phosphate phosphatase family protein
VRALFCDRDGTLIRDTGYPRDPAQVEILPGAVAALAELQKRFSLVVISNQSGIGRGIVRQDQFMSVDQRFRDLFAREGIAFEGVYYCPHTPDDGCDCRKPKPGLVERATRDLDIDVRASYFIGDKDTDVETGRTVGCKTVHFGSGSGAAADASISSWSEAPRVIV